MSVEHPSHRESEHSVDANFVEAADGFLDELTKLAGRCNSRQDFYRFLINRLQILVGGDNAWVSVPGASGDWVPVVIGEDGDGVIKLANESVIGLAVGDAMASMEVRTIELPGEVSVVYAGVVAGGVDGGSEFSGNECCICVRMKRASAPAWRRIHQDLISATTEIAVGFERRQQLQSQNDRFSRLESFVKLVRNSQSSLELEKTGYHLANDCRHFLGADRVWVFSKRGRVRFCACSNVATVNERSRTYKSLFSAVKQIDRNNHKEVILSEASDCPAALNRLVEYLKTESSVSGFYLSQLLDRPSGKVHGYFVAEFLQSHDCVTAVSALKNMLPVVENAIANSQNFSYLPGRGLMQTLGSVIDRFRLNALPRTLVAMLAIAAIIAALMLIKIDFDLPVAGQVRPSLERNTFAPTNSVVDQVLVEYGDTVNVGQPMLELVSSNYEEKLSGLQSELSAAAKELEANELLQSSSNDGERDPAFARKLIAQIEQNRLKVESIQKQIGWYLELQQELVVVAPISGVVVSRDIKLNLMKRPISIGSRLIAVADTSANWEIEFDVPDREFGYLREASRRGDVSDWKVAYRFESDLGNEFEAAIERHDHHQTINQDGSHLVRVFVPLEKEASRELRVGQSVVGRIHCGRRSVFFVWTRDIRDFFRANFFWM